MELFEKDGKIHDTILALSNSVKHRPNAIRASVQIEDFILNLSWVKDPTLLLAVLDEHRVDLNDDRNKDFYNRRILSLLGDFVHDDNFWLVICMKYPNYAKFHKNSSEAFKTAIRIVE